MTIRTLSALLAASSLLTACGSMDRLSNIGKAPEVTRIENPMLAEGYRPVSLPMPAQTEKEVQPNSLWDGSRQTFFKDQRASNIGDIITVMIDVKDKAELSNETERTRESDEKAGLDNLLGYETHLDQVLPEAVDNSALVGGSSDSSHKGTGTIDREEKITLKLAALVTQLLPNGNMVVHGRQEIRVNFEKRILELDGVIRPQDINIDNTISYEKVAEARITYGGQGQITDVQQPRYGQQLYDVIFPF